MNVDKPYTPEALCGRKMLVPIYQRLFVWDEDRIRKLLDDLFAASKNANADVPYYIGIITVHEKDGVWEIVDGQQRLTFLTLLGCALNRHKAVPQKQDGSKTWGDFVFLPQVGSDDNKNRISYVGRSGDEGVIRNWWNTKGALDFAGLRGSFGIFHNVFEKFLNDHQLKDSSPTCEGESGDLQKFGEYCFTKASFLINCLPQEYGPFDLNLYFEKMNSTGKQLEPIDVVKGKWFSSPEYVGKFNLCMNFDKTYTDQGNEAGRSETKITCGNNVFGETGRSEKVITLDKIVSGEIDGIPDDALVKSSLENRLPMKPEVLLLHALKLCLEWWNEHQKDKVDVVFSDDVSFDSKSLIKTFSNVFTDSRLTEEDKTALKKCFINDLVSYRSWIDENIIYLKGSGQSYDYEFRGKENSGNEIPTEEQQFQAMLYVSSGETQKWVLEAYRACRNSGGIPGSLDIELLKDQDRARHQLDVDTMTYPSIDKYWFWRIDYELWRQCRRDPEEFARMYLGGNKFTPQQERAVLDFRFRRNVSIEHLHPQSKGDKDWGYREDALARMHRLGNLAMMSVEANSAQSDDEIETKFGRVNAWIRVGRLESLKLLVMFVLWSGQQDGWTVDLAEKHRDQVLKLLKDKAGF